MLRELPGAIILASYSPFIHKFSTQLHYLEVISTSSVHNYKFISFNSNQSGNLKDLPIFMEDGSVARVRVSARLFNRPYYSNNNVYCHKNLQFGKHMVNCG